jgi:hypothetical protein
VNSQVYGTLSSTKLCDMGEGSNEKSNSSPGSWRNDAASRLSEALGMPSICTVSVDL